MVKAISSRILALLRHSDHDRRHTPHGHGPNGHANGPSIQSDVQRPSCEGAPPLKGLSAASTSQNLSAAVADVEVGLLQGQQGAEVRPHRLVVMADEVRSLTSSCSRADGVEKESSDMIRLTDVDVLEDVSSDARREGAWELQSGILMIHTNTQGHNAGRKYCLRVGADTADFAALLAKLRSLVAQAKREALGQTWGAKFHRSRCLVKLMFVSNTWQILVSLLILANFMANALECQYKLSLVNDDGTPTAFGQTLIYLDKFFTWVFTLELLLNLYAHWKDEFVKDGWNNFDLFVVATGHIALLLPGDVRIPILIFRLLRVFRVLRIFGRLKSIRHIINALIASLIPVLNVFFILAIVLAMYAIIGSTLFDDVDRQFHTLDRVIMLLFRIAAGMCVFVCVCGVVRECVRACVRAGGRAGGRACVSMCVCIYIRQARLGSTASTSPTNTAISTGRWVPM